jgi:regulator of RNase E activity RraA
MIDPTKYKKEIDEFGRHSTTLIADAMEKFGEVPDMTPLRELHHETKIAGPVYYVETYNESNWHLHEAIAHIPEGAVVFIEPIRCKKRAIMGEIVMDYIMLQRKAKGVIVNGYMRDITDIISKGHPLWYKGNNPVGCINKLVSKPSASEIEAELRENRAYYDHPQTSICIADAAGVVIIPEHKIVRVYQRVQEIAILEEIWKACIEAGMSTFETICQRRYEKGLEGPKFQRVRELYQSYCELRDKGAKLVK